MAYGYKSLAITSEYGARDPGMCLNKGSVGTKFLTYISEHPACLTQQAIKAATNKTNTHWSMVEAFKLNKLIKDVTTKERKKIKFTRLGKSVSATVTYVHHNLTLTKKGEKYLKTASARAATKPTKVVKAKKATKAKKSK